MMASASASTSGAGARPLASGSSSYYYSHDTQAPQQPRRKNKISKRQNARMQLAAALIEADNEAIEQRRQRQLQRERGEADLAGGDDASSSLLPRPPPLPQLKLASQSAIFAAWRDDEGGGDGVVDVDADPDARSPGLGDVTPGASQSTRRARSIQRPQSRDFLGINLPGDATPASAAPRPASVLSTAALSQQHSVRKRWSGSGSRRLSAGSALSRPQSILDRTAASRPHSRAGDVGDAGDGLAGDQPPLSSSSSSVIATRPRTADTTASATADDDATSRLGDWGMDKFLSTEARDTIARERQRTRSAASARDLGQQDEDEDVNASRLAGHARRGSNANTPHLARHARRDSNLSARTVGNVGGDVNNNADDDAAANAHSARATSDIVSVSKPQKGTNLELLARIKLYRERQENLPPSQWGADGSGDGSGDGIAFPSTATAAAADRADSSSSPPPPPPPLPSAPGLQLALGSPIHTPEPGAIPRQGSVSSHLAMTSDSPVDLNRRESSRGYFGESWSDAGSMMSHSGPSDFKHHNNGVGAGAASTSAPGTRKPSSVSAIGHLHPTVEEEGDGDGDDGGGGGDSDDDSDDDRPLGMAGIGSYLRSQSRRNSATLLDLPGGDFAQPVPAPARPSPLGPAFTSAAPPPARQPGPVNFEATAALQGDIYAALALGSSPYPGSAFYSGRQSPAPAGIFHHSPTFDQLPLAHNGTITPTLGTPRLGGAATLGTPRIGGATSLVPESSATNPALTTRQLQALARQSQFPDSYGIITPWLMEEEAAEQDEQQQQQQQDDRRSLDTASLASLPRDGWVPETQRGLFARALRGNTPAVDKVKADLAKLEPDLSKATWGQHKRRYSTGAFKAFGVGAANKRQKDKAGTAASNLDVREYSGYEPAVDRSLDSQTSEALDDSMHDGGDDRVGDLAAPDIDDDYISPPRKGPLKPRGLDACLPETLIMPDLLQGSAQQPRTTLTTADDDDGGGGDGITTAPHRRRQSGLYVPDGFVLHDGAKALPPIQKLTSTTGQVRFSFVFPAAAPDGIGRRAKMPSTALFRNQLVQHPDEQEGWGWEKSTAPVLDSSEDTSTEEPQKLTKKQIRRAKKTATKEAKIRYKRKRARAIRRKKRALAQAEGRSYADVGVPDESPAEDLSLTEDSVGYTSSGEDDNAGGDFDSDDEKRWVDEAKPAGKLFGKSLMDVAAEKQAQRHANRRFYGQQEIVEQEAFERASALQGDGASIMPPSEAGGRTFRDNPLGYNDTRQRMQAAFGVDANLARELEEKRIRDARAAEEDAIRRLAQEEYEREEAERKRRKEEKRNSRRIFAKKKNAKKQAAAAALAGASVSASASTTSFRGPQDRLEDDNDGGTHDALQAIENAQLLANEEQVATAPGSPPIPRAPLEAPRLDLGLSDGEQSKFGGSGPLGTRRQDAAAQWFAPSDGSPSSSEGDSDSEDEETRRKRALHRARLSRSFGGPGMGQLNLAGTALDGFGGGGGRADSDDEDEDEVPLSQLRRRAPLRQVSSNGNGNGRGGIPRKAAFADSSDDDDDPEGAMTLDEVKRRSMLKRQSAVNGGATPSVAAAAAARMPALAASSDEEVPLGQLQMRSRARQSAIGGAAPAAPASSDDDSDEDQPIGMRLDPTALAAFKKNGPAAAPTADSDDGSDDEPIGVRHSASALAAHLKAHALAHGQPHHERCECGRRK